MSEHQVRTVAESEFRDAVDLFRGSLHRRAVRDEDWPKMLPRYQPGRIFGAFVGDELIGTTMSLESALAVPGGAVLPAAAVTGVGVRADRTRRGALTALMRAQLNAVRANGEPLAMLHASETRIYGRYGYGVASRARRVLLRRSESALRQEIPRTGRVRLVDARAASELLPGIYRRIGLERPGMIARNDPWWLVRLTLWNEGPVAVHTNEDGVDDGFMIYDVQHANSTFGHEWTTMRISDSHAADAGANLELWRFALEMDLAHEVLAIDRPVDEPLEWWLEDRRSCRVGAVEDDLWVRLVDVPRALDAREFGPGRPVVLEVRDSLLPGNSGNYRITPDGVGRSDDPGGLAIDADALAALYLGDVSVSDLVAAHRVTVRDPAAVAAADDLFRTRRLPWCGTGF